MVDTSQEENQIQNVNNCEELIATPFLGNINAMCWNRKLKGDFSEIVDKVALIGNITELNKEDLLKLN